jgi:hypothetical protein
MGTCCSIKPENRVYKLPVKPLSIYYLNTKFKSIYKIDGDKLQKVKMPKFNINNNCAVGHLSDGSIIIIGGTKTSGRLSKKVLLVSPSGGYVTKLPSLKRPTYKGSVHQVDSTIYYFSQDLSMPHQRYNNKFWEIIDYGKLDLNSVSVLRQDHIFYFLCGQKPNGKPTKKLYALDISNSSTYEKMNHKLNFKLINPICYSGYDYVVVGGGKKPNGCDNFSYFIQTNGEWKEIQGPDCILENYPCLYSNRLCIFIAKNSKIVTLDCALKFKVYQNKKKKQIMKRSATVFTPTTRINKYRRNSRYLQDVLNNYVTFQSNLSSTRLEFCQSPSNSDSSENEKDQSAKTPSIVQVSLSKTEVISQ